ncbi:dockerin type I repeat-containing protein [Ammoniphilus sp. 3BR4]|uniref:dockerin type I repeat-containing protein n=1 Tax=Ammoniphilus sp. 3BR4 TaxID=3158265 RepID=UPI0034677DDF
MKNLFKKMKQKTVALSLAIPLLVSSTAYGAIIDNGTVQLGINNEGHLNVWGGTPSWESYTEAVGLRYIPTNGESTAPGCLCEGWGVANADPATGSFAGYANVSSDGGVNNLNVVESVVTATYDHTLSESEGSAFKSVVTTGGGRLKVTHEYKPASTPNLYVVEVTMENIGTDEIGDLRYRRVMDWDIAPRTFSEHVELHVGNAANVIRATTDGFHSANPLYIYSPSSGGPAATLIPGSPDYMSTYATDQGSLFDFGFGSLAVGETRTFKTYYGAAETRDQILNALANEGAEVYSLGIPSGSSGEPLFNGPHIFAFGFGGVGGTVIAPPAPVFDPTHALPTPNPRPEQSIELPPHLVQPTVEVSFEGNVRGENGEYLAKKEENQVVWANVYLDNLQDAKGLDFTLSFSPNNLALDPKAVTGEYGAKNYIDFGEFTHKDLHLIYNMDKMADGKVNLSFASKNAVTGSATIRIPFIVTGNTDREIAFVGVQDLVVVNSDYEEIPVEDFVKQIIIRTKGTVTGKVTLQGREVYKGSRVVAMKLNASGAWTKEAETVTHNTYGEFAFDLVPGEYIFLADREKYQSAVYKESIELVQADEFDIEMKLNTGDAVGTRGVRIGDDKVNLLDLTSFVEDYALSLPASADLEYFAADFDGNGKVDVIDFSLLAMNYNLKGIAAQEGKSTLDEFISYLETVDTLK